ncbi:uncharacterized protein MEPE_02605 [Melanopsichium pennsylvanicum]|uniref:Uncharacterized protein n=1 Tax=Melanopsichium pennsylvanicum TaxID=63383 RepID=A0AAJ5C4Q0_9BASI|nr:uncharacterized protein MEPE_02605 [Melanopsichium pennsylvanicum]
MQEQIENLHRVFSALVFIVSKLDRHDVSEPSKALTCKDEGHVGQQMKGKERGEETTMQRAHMGLQRAEIERSKQVPQKGLGCSLEGACLSIELQASIECTARAMLLL